MRTQYLHAISTLLQAHAHAIYIYPTLPHRIRLRSAELLTEPLCQKSSSMDIIYELRRSVAESGGDPEITLIHLEPVCEIAVKR